ncbi:MAG: hypothetical protein AAB412_05625 [Elusimicrobiota bacterium]
MERAFFWMFAASGFAGLAYEVLWLRLSMAAFGVNAPVVSFVLSAFMAGLGLGSWAGGRFAAARADRNPGYFLRLYAAAEASIALSAFAVPFLLDAGRGALAAHGASWGSWGYYGASGLCVGLALLPGCFCMGATFPLALAAGRSLGNRTFSFLYQANVLGAACGAFVCAFFLIELAGLRGSSHAAAVLNLAAAAGGLFLSLQPPQLGEQDGIETGQASAMPGPRALGLLFLAGLCGMGMELVWTRQFTPYLSNTVYAFAAMLTFYIGSTFLGTRYYRSKAPDRVPSGETWAVLGALGLFPLAAADPALPLPMGVGWGLLRMALGIGPFCAALGFLTPLLVDRLSGGDPERAASAYAVNVLGCILGPLLAAFLLLPYLGERGSLAAFAMPLFLAGLAAASGRRVKLASLAVGAALVLACRSFEERYGEGEIRRDHEATVLAAGQGRNKVLYVNGTGMTVLTPITKMMAHLPLAFLDRRPESALAVAFGMGTSFRSLLTWDLEASVVDLVPSVPELFGYFHEDGPELARSAQAEIVIDDGRRFLERTGRSYDLITIDPPPPVEAAGSSLLYSKEFYALAKSRLKPGGLLQQWVPGGAEPYVEACFARAITESFPYVRVFRAWGLHFLASDSPIPARTAKDLAVRLSTASAKDLVEWGPQKTAERQFQAVLDQEIAPQRLLEAYPNAPALTDDRPDNEYFLLRRLLRRIP